MVLFAYLRIIHWAFGSSAPSILSLFPPGMKWLVINKLDAYLCSFTWLYEEIYMYLKMRVFNCCNMSLFEHMQLNYVNSRIAYYSSRYIRPCEPTICVGVVVCKFIIVCLRVIRLYMLGWVLRVCDPSSCELWCVAVELWDRLLWLSLLQVYFIRL